MLKDVKFSVLGKLNVFQYKQCIDIWQIYYQFVCGKDLANKKEKIIVVKNVYTATAFGHTFTPFTFFKNT